MTRSIKNMLVGLFIIGAISLLVATIMFLRPSVGDGKQTIFVRFSDIGNIHVGTRVLFAGMPVGEVYALNEINDARQQPTDELGRVYFYQLTLHIDSKVNIFNTDEVSIATSGLMGEKSISITPKAPPLGVTPRLVTNQPIYADSVDMLQNAMVDFSDLAASMEQTFTQMSEWINEHGSQLATTIQAAGSALMEVEQAVNAYNQSEFLADLQSTTQSFDTTLQDLHLAMVALQGKDAFANAGDTVKNLKEASYTINAIADNVIKGKGTIGKLIDNNDVYLQINAVMAKVNNLLNDVNQYGVLFHLNKEWQRTHLVKMRELNALKNPESFKTYFEGEVAEINSAMTRISMLIERADQSQSRTEILSNPAFRRDFAELLMRADQLSGTLKLYNQQLNDAAGN